MVSLVRITRNLLSQTFNTSLLFHAKALAFPSSEILQRLYNPRMRKRLPLSSVPKVVYLRGLNAYRKRAFNGFWRWQRSVRLSVLRCVWQLAALIRDQGSINRRRESSVVLTLTPSLVSQSQLHDDEIHTRRVAQPPQGHQFVTDPALRSCPPRALWTLIMNGRTVGLKLGRLWLNW